MKKKLRFFALLAALMVPWAANAQLTLTVAQGTQNTEHAPWYPYWTDIPYHTEVVYPASMLEDMAGGTITSVAFYTTSTNVDYSSLGGTSVTVRMSEVSATASTVGGSWLTANGTLVYTGTVSIANGVHTLVLDEPFLYEGNGNLAISYSFPGEGDCGTSRVYFRGISSSTPTGAFSSNSGVGSPAYSMSYLPEATFTYTEGSGDICYAVSQLTVVEFDSVNATISWSPRGDESSWAIYLNGVLEDEVSDTAYTFTTLTAATAYTVGVQAICGADDSSRISTTSFATSCVYLTADDLPQVHNFDNLTASSTTWEFPCWTTLNFYTNTCPYVSSSYAYSGSNSLYFYPGYSNQPQFLVSPAVEDLSGTLLSFMFEASTSIRMSVGYMTNPTDTSTFVALQSIVGTGTGASYWQLVEQSFSNLPDNARHAAIRIGVTSSWDYPAYIDDLTLMVLPDCMAPAEVIVSGVTTDEATITVVDPTEVGNYTYYLQQGATVVDSGDFNDTTYTFTNLTPASAYSVSVVANCDDGTRTRAVTASFATDCINLTADDLPQVHNFDNLTASTTTWESPCWTTLNFYTNTCPYVSSSYAYSGSNSLYFYPGYSNQPQFLVSPAVEDLSGTLLSFMFEASTSIRMSVGYMTNPTDTSTFVALQSIVGTGTGASYWQLVEQSFSNLPDNARHAAIRIGVTSSWDYPAYIDDLTLMVLPDCMAPAEVIVSGVTTDEATITVVDPTEVGNYTYYLQQGATVVDSATVGDTSYTFTNLTPASTYSVSVVANCDDGTRTRAVTSFFTTNCASITTLPWTEGFENHATNQVPTCWTHLSTINSTSGNFMQVYNYYAHNGSNCLRFKYSYATGNLVLLPPFEDDISGLEMSFWHRPESNTNSSCGTMQVGYVTNSADASTFVATASYAYNDFTSTDYRQDEVTFAGAPEGARIAFRHVASGYNWYWHVDDIDVHVAPTCVRPTAVAVRDISTNGATVSIVDPNDAGHYMLYINNDSVELYDTTYTFTDLSASTSYSISVVTICDDGTRTSAVSTSFRTECDAISALPWSDDFESYTGESGAGSASSVVNIPCWNVYQNYSYYSFVQTGWNHEGNGNKAIRIYAGDSYPTYMVLPPFTEDLENLVFSYWANFDNSTLHMVVGYMSDSLTSSFVAIDTVYAANSSEQNVWGYHETVFPTGAEGRIAYRFYGSGTSNVRLDDFTVFEAPSCGRPSAVVVSNISATGADITVTDNNDNPNYEVKLYAGNTLVDSISLTSSTYSFTDLTASTDYTVSVVSVCDDGTANMPVTVSFRTFCVAIANSDLPWTEGFESYTASSSFNAPCYTVLNRYSNYYPNVTNSSSYVHSGSKALAIYSYGNNPTIVALPAFEDDLADLFLTFSLKTGSSGYGLEVGVLTNPSDASTFQSISTCLPSSTSNYERYEATFAGHTSGLIAFRYSGSGYATVYLDSITVQEVPSCVRPSSVSFSDITSTGATVTINDPNNTDDYVVVCGTDSTEVTSSTYTFIGLNPGTVYAVRAYTVCDDGTLVGPVSVNFMTLLESTTVPYQTGFEAGEDSLWTLINGANGWVLGSAANNGGSRSIYISNDGSTNSYNIGTTTISYAIRAFDITDTGTYAVSFDWRAYGEESYDFLRSWIAPSTATFVADLTPNGTSYANTWTTANPAGWIDLGGKHNYQNSWQNQYNEVRIDAAGTYYLVFMWANNGSGGTMPPAAVDNVAFSLLNCERPSNIVLDSATTESIAFHWTGTADSYLIVVDGEEYTTSDNSYELTSLSASTAYTVFVRALCGSDTSLAANATFRTACGAITALPWTEDFESMAINSAMPCWGQWYETGNAWAVNTGKVFVASGEGYGNSKGLKIRADYYTTPDTAMAILPTFSAQANQLEVSYMLKRASSLADSSYYHVDFGVVTDPSDPSTFVSFEDLGTLPITFTQYTHNLSSYAGADGNLAFRFVYTKPTDYWWIWIDSIVVDYNNNTPQPTQYTVSLATSDASMGTVSPAGTTTVNAGSSFTATATPANNHIFTGWVNAAGDTVSFDNPYIFTVNANVSLTGTFRYDGVGIESAEAGNISLFPNPATGMVTVSGIEAKATVTLVDINGHTAGQWTADEGSLTIDLAGYATGTYFVRIVGEQGVAVLKLIVK